MKVFHGGSFTPTPNHKYFGGKVQYVDLLHIKHFRIDIIHSIVKRLKYDPREIMYYQFKIPNETLDCGLRALGSDYDIVNLSKYVIDINVIEIYIEHGETTVESYYMATNVENNEDVIGGDMIGQSSDIGGDKVDVQGDEANLGGGGDKADIEGEKADVGSGEEADVGNGDKADVGGDSDVELVDDEHVIEPVDVPMEGFRFNLDDDERERDTVADPLRPKLTINEEDLEVIDYDSYESELGQDDNESAIKASILSGCKRFLQNIGVDLTSHVKLLHFCLS